MILTFGKVFISNLATVFSFTFNVFVNKNPNVNYFSGYDAFSGIEGYSIGYFILGGIIFNNREYFKTKKYKYFSIFIVPISMLLLFLYGIIVSKKEKNIWDIVFAGYASIFTMVNVVALFIITLWYKKFGFFGRIVKLISENSLGIYLLHFLVGTFFLPYFLSQTYSSSIVANAIFALIILILTLVLVTGFKKIPILKLLFII